MISVIEQAQIDFSKSIEKRHYPDDGLFQKYEKMGLKNWDEYMNAWRECWEEKYDRNHK